MRTALRLRAEDAEDLGVIAACLQDALVHVGEMTYQARKRRFVIAVNRVIWENAGSRRGGAPKRVRSGVHFDGVLEVKTQGVRQHEQGQLLELLTLACEEGEDGAATVSLLFAGGAEVRLVLECIDCTLTDMGASWPARAKPGHEV